MHCVNFFNTLINTVINAPRPVETESKGGKFPWALRRRVLCL